MMREPSQAAAMDVAVHQVEHFDPEFSVTPDWSARGQWLAVDRDGHYLEWRYVLSPTKAYSILECRRGDAVVGYSVYSSAGQPGRLGLARGYLYDLVVGPDDQEAADALVAETLTRMRSSGIQIATTWLLPDGVERKALAKQGFSYRLEKWRDRMARTTYEGPLVMLALRGDMNEMTGTEDPTWYLTPGDADYM